MDMEKEMTVKEPPIMSPIPITSPEEAIDLVGKEIREMDREVVAVINLKQDGIPINFNIASRPLLMGRKKRDKCWWMRGVVVE